MKKILAATLAILLFAGSAHAITDRLGAKYSLDFNQTKTLSKTTAYTVTTTDGGALINGDTTSAGFTVTLPLLSTVAASGQSMSVKIVKTDASVNVLTIAPATGNTIGGESARKIINQNGFVILTSQGKDWSVDFESPYVVEDHEAGTANIGTQSYGASIVFEGASADAYETTLAVTDPTADVTYQLPTGGAGTVYVMSSSLATNFADIANSVTGASNGMLFEGATADAYETTLTVTDATADRTVTMPDATGTVALTAGLGSRVTVTAGSGTTTVTTAHCGGVLTAAADADGVFNLPATSAGCLLRFVNIGAAANNLLTINPDNADQIFGTVTLASSVVAIAGSAGDAVSNTKGTSIRGDSMTLLGDGVDGWYIVSSTGIWADIN